MGLGAAAAAGIEEEEYPYGCEVTVMVFWAHDAGQLPAAPTPAPAPAVTVCVIVVVVVVVVAEQVEGSDDVMAAGGNGAMLGIAGMPLLAIGMPPLEILPLGKILAVPVGTPGMGGALAMPLGIPPLGAGATLGMPLGVPLGILGIPALEIPPIGTAAGEEEDERGQATDEEEPLGTAKTGTAAEELDVTAG